MEFQDARFAAVEAAKALVREATEAARGEEPHSQGWHFYHGVEAAAVHVLHPEIASVRDGTSWLGAEHPAFREGFLEASTLLATASTLREPPLRVRLPQPAQTR